MGRLALWIHTIPFHNCERRHAERDEVTLSEAAPRSSFAFWAAWIGGVVLGLWPLPLWSKAKLVLLFAGFLTLDDLFFKGVHFAIALKNREDFKPFGFYLIYLLYGIIMYSLIVGFTTTIVSLIKAQVG